MNEFDKFARDAIRVHLAKMNIYAPDNIDAQLNAMQTHFKNIEGERAFKVLGRGFSYPFGQNQAEWERALFIRGWNACLDWVRKELSHE